MTVSRLECPICGFASQTFSETMDPFSGRHACVFQRTDDHRIVIKRILNRSMTKLGFERHAPGAKALIQKHFAAPWERHIEIPTIESSVPVEAVCPRCGDVRLVKQVVARE